MEIGEKASCKMLVKLTLGKSRKRKKVLSTESDEDNQADVYIECRRSVVDVRQMLNQWKYFRHNENFTGTFQTRIPT